MRLVEYVTHMRDKEMPTGFWWGKLKEEDLF
jgi:hypothetical protein